MSLTLRTPFREYLSIYKESVTVTITLIDNPFVKTGYQFKNWECNGKKYNPDGATRVHGGGFAGCTLNVVKNENLDYFLTEMSKVFGDENLIVLSIRSVGTITL